MKRKWVYIISPSFSGSTLLTFLLGIHPEIATVGELKASAMGDIELYDCSCGERIRSCPFWTAVTAEMHNRGMNFNLANFGTQFCAREHSLANRILTARLRNAAFEFVRGIALRVLPEARRTFRRILETNFALSEVVSNLQVGTVFLDGSKDPIRLKYLLAADMWDIQVIHLMRDGRGVANSYMKHYGISMLTAAIEWRQAHEAAERLRARLPESAWIKVHYEHLCRDVDPTLRNIFGYLGLESDAASQDFHSIENHILGNTMRLSNSSEISLDEKWRSELSVADLAAFDRVAGNMNRKHGYE